MSHETRVGSIAELDPSPAARAGGFKSTKGVKFKNLKRFTAADLARHMKNKVRSKDFTDVLAKWACKVASEAPASRSAGPLENLFHVTKGLFSVQEKQINSRICTPGQNRRATAPVGESSSQNDVRSSQPGTTHSLFRHRGSNRLGHPPSHSSRLYMALSLL